jgi:hypothetical protein
MNILFSLSFIYGCISLSLSTSKHRANVKRNGSGLPVNPVSTPALVLKIPAVTRIHNKVPLGRDARPHADSLPVRPASHVRTEMIYPMQNSNLLNNFAKLDWRRMNPAPNEVKRMGIAYSEYLSSERAQTLSPACADTLGIIIQSLCAGLWFTGEEQKKQLDFLTALRERQTYLKPSTTLSPAMRITSITGLPRQLRDKDEGRWKAKRCLEDLAVGDTEHINSEGHR